MRRGHDFPLATLLVALLAIAVVAGTGYAWVQYDRRVAEDTDVESVLDPGGRGEDLPDAPGLPSDSPEDADEPAYEPPTFDTLTPTANRPRPVLLLIGDGWAAGDGASREQASYAALLADDLGWDVRTIAEAGAGYTVPGAGGSTVLDMYDGAPLGSIDPDAILVQAGYAGATDTKAVTRAIADLRDRIAADLPGTPVVAVGSFRPQGVDAKQEAAMAKAWRAVDGTLVLRPTKEGWSDLPTGAAGNPLDAGHRRIATSLEQAFRDAGLVPQA